MVGLTWALLTLSGPSSPRARPLAARRVQRVEVGGGDELVHPRG